MSPSETPPSPPAFNFQQWFARLGTSGKLLAIGGVVGAIAVFLPLISFTVDVMGVAGGRHSSMVIDTWQGVVCLIAYIGAIVSAFLIYPSPGSANKAPGWLGLAVGAAAAVCAVDSDQRIFATSNASDFFGMGGEDQRRLRHIPRHAGRRRRCRRRVLESSGRTPVLNFHVLRDRGSRTWHAVIVFPINVDRSPSATRRRTHALGVGAHWTFSHGVRLRRRPIRTVPARNGGRSA